MLSEQRIEELRRFYSQPPFDHKASIVMELIEEMDGLKESVRRLHTENEQLMNGIMLNLTELRNRAVRFAFKQFKGNREKMAEALGVGSRTLLDYMRDCGFRPRATAADVPPVELIEKNEAA
jgi:DNA-binding NtrC family response regulator